MLGELPTTKENLERAVSPFPPQSKLAGAFDNIAQWLTEKAAFPAPVLRESLNPHLTKQEGLIGMMWLAQGGARRSIFWRRVKLGTVILSGFRVPYWIRWWNSVEG